MKHLKKYNESLDVVTVDELKDYCDTSLIYLLDKGYEIDTSIFYLLDKVYEIDTSKGHINVFLTLPDTNKRRSSFSWNSIKDHYIPFLQMIQKRYKLYNRIVFNTFSGTEVFRIEEVINDDIDQDIVVDYITIQIPLK